MINLLPPDLKIEYRYAKKNRKILRWVVALFLSIFGVAVLTGSTLVLFHESEGNYRSNIASAQIQLSSDNYTKVVQQVSDISNNLSLMVSVLSKEILFSKLLNRLGSITPPNVILTNLSISQPETAVTITALTGNYNAATQLQVNLSDPNNQIFQKADIISITCSNSNSTSANPNYPCTTIIRAQFSNNNPFLFINSQSVSG